MKKFLFSMLAVICGVLSVSAQYQFTLNIPDATHVQVLIDYVEQPIQNGANQLTVQPNKSVTIKSRPNCLLTQVVDDATGAKQSVYSGTCYIYVKEQGKSYTLTSVSYADVRTNAVKLTIDDPTNVDIIRKSSAYTVPDAPFTAQAGENIIPFWPGNEDQLLIKHKNYGRKLYKVTVNGVEVAATGTNFAHYVTLPCEGDIDVQANFPEVNCPVTFDFSESEPGIVKSVSVEGAGEVDFSTGSFSALMGKEVTVTIDKDNYNFTAAYINGENKGASSPLRFVVAGETTVKLVGVKYQTFPFTIDIDNPANVIIYKGASWQGVTYSLQPGLNNLEMSSKDGKIEVKSSKTGCVVTFTRNGADVPAGTMAGTFNSPVAEGDAFVMTTRKYARNKKSIVYIDDLSAAPSYFKASTNLSYVLNLSSGYNTVMFDPADSPFIFSGLPTAATRYVNGERYTGYGFQPVVTEGTVLKVFMNGDPAKYNTTFTVGEGAAAADFKVYADKVTELTDLTAPFTAFAGTSYIIAPEAGKSLKVSVNGQPLTAGEDGNYEFFLGDNNEVTVSGTSNGLSDILAPAAGNGLIYNVQGICLGSDFTSLPAGLYIQNGKKVIKK